MNSNHRSSGPGYGGSCCIESVLLALIRTASGVFKGLHFKGLAVQARKLKEGGTSKSGNK